jgi:hypothetical protein
MIRILPFITLLVYTQFTYAQAEQWAFSYGGAQNEINAGIVVDANDNIYQSGHFAGTVDFDPGSNVASYTSAGITDIFITKFTPDGNWLWTKTIGGVGIDEAKDFAIDQTGNLVILGIFSSTVDFDPNAGNNTVTSNGSRDGYVLKLTTDGDFVWVRTFGGTSAEQTECLTTDLSNNIIFTGKFLDIVDFNPGAGTYNLDAEIPSYSRYYAKWSEAGDFIWAETLIENSVIVYDMIADNTGNIFYAGSFTGTADMSPGTPIYELQAETSGGITSDGYIMKMDASGNMIWAKDYGNTANDEIYALYFNSAGDLITGCTTATATLMNVNPLNGTVIWSKLFGGRIYDLTLDSNNQIYLCCSFNGTVDLDSTPFEASYTAEGYSAGAVMKLSATGDYIWSGLYSGEIGSYAYEIDIQNNDDIIVSGVFDDVVDLDATDEVSPYTSNGMNDIYVLKLAPCLAPIQIGTIEGDITPCIPDTITYAVVNIDETTTFDWLTSHPNTYFTSNDVQSNGLFISTSQTVSIQARPYNDCGVGTVATLSISPAAYPYISIAATPNDSICEGNSLKLDANVTSSTSFSWSGGITDNTYFQPAASGYYYVTALNNNDCTTIDSIYVHVTPAFTVDVLVEPEGFVHCEGAEVTFTGSGAEYYTYGNGIQDGVPFVPTQEIFIATGHVGNCSINTSITLNIQPLPVLVVNLSPEGPVCEGQPVNVLVTGADTFVFEPSHINGLDVTPTETTTYSVDGSIVGCSSYAEFTIEVIPQPSFTTQPTNQNTVVGTAVNFSVTAIDAASYQWQVNTGSGFNNISNGATYSNTTTATLTVLNPTLAMNGYDYRCIISNNDCDATSSNVNLAVTIDAGIESMTADSGLHVFPNPTSSDCKLTTSAENIGRNITVFDVAGKCIMSEILLQNSISLPSSTWEPGVYLISIQGTTSRMKLTVTK